MERVVPDLQQGYVDLIRWVAGTGRPASPRGIPTRELIDVTLAFHDPTSLLPVGVGRKVSVPFNAAGAASLVGGVSYHELMLRIAPRFAEFDADGVDRERYGPRTVDQVEGVVNHLLEDPHSREALVVLQPPRTANADGGRVFPCTTFFQFLLRDDALHMLVKMRSNDVWSGLSGDAWTFSQLHRTLAWVLGVDVGSYLHNAGSLHVYDRDLDKIAALTEPTAAPVRAAGFAPADTRDDLGIRDPLTRLKAARGWARSALGVLPGEAARPRPESVEWYHQKLEKFVRPNYLCWACMGVHESTRDFALGQCPDCAAGKAVRATSAERVRRWPTVGAGSLEQAVPVSIHNNKESNT